MGMGQNQHYLAMMATQLRSMKTHPRLKVYLLLTASNGIFLNKVCTVSHFSYAPFFQGPHFWTKMLDLNILYDNLLIDILSV